MQVRTSGLNLMPLPRPNKSAADHPHGGGRGKSKGNVDPVSPWGMPVSHCDSSLVTAQLLNLCRPKEATRLERSESQTNGLSQLENEIKGNEKSSSEPCYLWLFTTLRSVVYKRSPSMYHTRKKCTILYDWPWNVFLVRLLAALSVSFQLLKLSRNFPQRDTESFPCVSLSLTSNPPSGLNPAFTYATLPSLNTPSCTTAATPSERLSEFKSP